MRKAGTYLILSLVLVGCGGNGSNHNGAPTQVFGSADAGLVNGDLLEARFSNPVNVAVSGDGIVYVADFDNDVVRAISPQGIVSTLVDQNNFSRPFGLAVTSSGRLFVQTDANDLGERNATTGTVWEVDRATGAATVIARNLGRPRGLTALSNGQLALSDLSRSTVYLLNPANGAVTPLAGSDGVAGFQNGNGTNARFDRPYGIDVLQDGSLLVADQNNNRLRRVTLAGDVSTFAGTGVAGAANGAVLSATFNHPEDVAVAPDGTIYVSDHDNHVIRRIAGGQVTTFAGNGTAGFADGTGTMAEFFGLEGIDLTPNGGSLWIADGNNGDGGPYNRVRRFRTR